MRNLTISFHSPAEPGGRPRPEAARDASSEKHQGEPFSVRQSHQVDLHSGDPDLHKGATDDQGNANAAGALDDEGLPVDKVAIAEDAVGANIDKTQG
ncbi:MAG: hypothetical protein O2930_05540 [Acidobacteria bacterium]|nr:hypothetical protein [Acidobacteriota bacterium]